MIVPTTRELFIKFTKTFDLSKLTSIVHYIRQMTTIRNIKLEGIIHV